VDCSASFIPYSDTFQFSTLVLDYLRQAEGLKPFYHGTPDIEGVKTAIASREQFDTNRSDLVKVLKDQYAATSASALQLEHIDALARTNCFTITTAHQPNIFTGYLYAIYKTLHVIRIAEELKSALPQYQFVPVFYIGSEDNDLDELSQCNIDGVKHRWQTQQKGAVGRMKVDKSLLSIIDGIDRQLGQYQYGKELIEILRNAYPEGGTIANGTFSLLNQLFARYGLLVLQPDNAVLKKQMKAVFESDLLHQLPHALVEQNSTTLAESYKVQVNPREINLFYLDGLSRERISISGENYVTDGGRQFSKSQILEELDNNPEKFSPNVVLRGIYQATILPDILFVGGGSEIAYWLELKSLFEYFKVPYPVLILRNSFLLTTAAQKTRVEEMGWKINELFKPDFDIMNDYVKNHSAKKLQLGNEINSVNELYAKLREEAEEIDITLGQHISALEHKVVKQLRNLEKKLIRAEKRNFETQQRQLQKIKLELFPNNNLQERVDNFMPYFAKYGPSFIDCIYQQSKAFSQEFGIIELGNQ
jgi:bacillithiol biosynthesis cysteine-adding enzyme BshC